MSNNKFGLPTVLFSGGLDETDDPGLIGGGSAQSSANPCTFDYWFQNFKVDLDNDGDKDFDDYRLWWAARGFTSAAWNEFNPGVSSTPGDPFPSQNP